MRPLPAGAVGGQKQAIAGACPGGHYDDDGAEGLGVLMSEMAILRKIMLACGNGAARLWRNQVGQYELADGRILRSGLCKGSSDLIGWQTVEVTPEMVGQRVAVFVALEVKDRGRLTAEQAQFLEVVRRAGGIAGEVRSVEDAEALLRRGCG